MLTPTTPPPTITTRACVFIETLPVRRFCCSYPHNLEGLAFARRHLSRSRQPPRPHPIHHVYVQNFLGSNGMIFVLHQVPSGASHSARIGWWFSQSNE